MSAANDADPGRRPAWSADQLENPHAVGDKATRVERMFAAIADSYDLNNRLHSFGRDQAWRKAAVRAAGLSPGDRVVDVACGTGDLSEAYADAGAGVVIGIDFTVAMLEIAERKRGRRDRPTPIVYAAGDAMRLPVADAAADVVSIAFGIRNVADPAAALAEFRRVLKPGGRLVILEFSEPTHPVLRWGSRVWTQHIMPRTATWIARDRSGAYRYLPRSVATFAGREQMIDAMREAGFEDVTAKPQTFGVAVIYRGVSPG